MTTYTIVTNSKTQKSGVHAPTCSVATAGKRGLVYTQVEAISAAAAAAEFDAAEQAAERGLKCTSACACGKVKA